MLATTTLPATTTVEAAAEVTKKNIARDYENREWTIGDLQGAILKEIHILELDIQNINTLTSQPPDILTASFITTTTRKKNHTGVKKHSCVFCKGNHSPLICDVMKRVEIIKREKLCFNCFRHHNVSVYTSKYHCRKCNGKHLKVLYSCIYCMDIYGTIDYPLIEPLIFSAH